MIFTLLYLSPLLKNNEHRNIYLYTIGTLIYTVFHWLLFSSFGSGNSIISKYRNALYAIVLVDFWYVNKNYKDFLAQTKNNTKKESHVIIEQVDDVSKHQVEQIKQICNDDVCINEHNKETDKETDRKDNKEDDKNCEDDEKIKDIKNETKDVTSVASIPVYKPKDRTENHIQTSVQHEIPQTEIQAPIVQTTQQIPPVITPIEPQVVPIINDKNAQEIKENTEITKSDVV